MRWVRMGGQEENVGRVVLLPAEGEKQALKDQHWASAAEDGQRLAC